MPNDNKPPAELTYRVHILLHGRALCGFEADRVPGEWPPGEVWIGYDQNPKGALPAGDRCPACFELFEVPRSQWWEHWPEAKQWKGDARVAIELSRSEADTVAAVITEIRCGTMPELARLPRETVAELDRVHVRLVHALNPTLTPLEARKKALGDTSDVVLGARQIDPVAFALSERQRIAIAEANEAIAVLGDRVAEGAKRYLEGVERAAADLNQALCEWYDRHVNATTPKRFEMPLDVHTALGPEQIDEALAADPEAPRVTAEVVAPPCYCPDPIVVDGKCKQCGRRHYEVCLCPEPELVKIDWERGEQACSICGKPYDETIRLRQQEQAVAELVEAADRDQAALMALQEDHNLTAPGGCKAKVAELEGSNVVACDNPECSWQSILTTGET